MIDLASLILVCAPFVDPGIMQRIVYVESKGNPWAIGVPKRVLGDPPRDYHSAVQRAKKLITEGHNIDMGYAQINVKTMRQLGLTVEQVFDPCTNLYAGATVLWRFYMLAEKKLGANQQALLAAFSAYNTGNFRAGFKNGYVDKILKAGR